MNINFDIKIVFMNNLKNNQALTNISICFNPLLKRQGNDCLEFDHPIEVSIEIEFYLFFLNKH